MRPASRALGRRGTRESASRRRQSTRQSGTKPATARASVRRPTTTSASTAARYASRPHASTIRNHVTSASSPMSSSNLSRRYGGRGPAAPGGCSIPELERPPHGHCRLHRERRVPDRPRDLLLRDLHLDPDRDPVRSVPRPRAVRVVEGGLGAVPGLHPDGDGAGLPHRPRPRDARPRGQGAGGARKHFEQYVRETASSPVDELHKLADLKDRGAISDAEYEKMKAKL